MATRATLGAAIALAALWLAPAAATAEPATTGESWVVAVDLGERTVRFENGQVLRATPATRIVDASGGSIPLAEVPVSPEVNGLRALLPASGAHYEADAEGRLRRLQVGVPVTE